MEQTRGRLGLGQPKSKATEIPQSRRCPTNRLVLQFTKLDTGQLQGRRDQGHLEQLLRVAPLRRTGARPALAQTRQGNSRPAARTPVYRLGRQPRDRLRLRPDSGTFVFSRDSSRAKAARSLPASWDLVCCNDAGHRRRQRQTGSVERTRRGSFKGTSSGAPFTTAAQGPFLASQVPHKWPPSSSPRSLQQRVLARNPS